MKFRSLNIYKDVAYDVCQERPFLESASTMSLINEEQEHVWIKKLSETSTQGVRLMVLMTDELTIEVALNGLSETTDKLIMNVANVNLSYVRTLGTLLGYAMYLSSGMEESGLLLMAAKSCCSELCSAFLKGMSSSYGIESEESSCSTELRRCMNLTMVEEARNALVVSSNEFKAVIDVAKNLERLELA